MSFLNNKILFPVAFNKKNSLFFYAAYLSICLWIIFSIISIFFVGVNNLSNGFVIFSILFRIIISCSAGFFLYLFFIKRIKDKKIYNYFKAFTGYGIVLTYVFYSFPRIVGEFNKNITFNSAVFNYITVVFITIFPVVLYLLLNLDKTRLILEVATKKDLDLEKRMKKDKKLKKNEQNKMKKNRNFLEYLWYEWIDVILQAIIIAMLIQQFAFQMYQIPSESMVPTFLIKDRVIANKFIYGPHIPLTDWKIGALRKPKVGDIVVFKNPAMEYPGSDVSYNNVFTRMFHPFVYMATLSLVDIDKKKDGRPKERLLVKRLVANEGEKLCMVNDKVYKKTEASSWMLMDNINNQREYGRVNLYYENVNGMRDQKISIELREVLNNAELLIQNENIDELEAKLEIEKARIINKVNKLNLKYIDYLDSVYENHLVNAEEVNSRIRDLLSRVYTDPLVDSSIKDDLIYVLKLYSYNVIYKSVYDLYNIMILSQDNNDFLDKNIITKLNMDNDLSPYYMYMKKVNAVYKLYRLHTLNIIIDKIQNLDEILTMNRDYTSFIDQFNESEKTIINNYYLMNMYFFKTEITHIVGNVQYYSIANYFASRQFSDFPSNPDEYIAKNDYFMMGDNRYNSLDNRHNGPGEDKYTLKKIFIDKDDTTYFSTTAEVDWNPRTINIRHVLGKAAMIYWPLDRLKILSR